MGMWGGASTGAQRQTPGQGVRGTKSPEADDIFLFQRLIS